MSRLPPPVAPDRLALDRPAPARRTAVRPASVLLLACGIGTLIGAALPWATLSASFIPTVHTPGIDVDGRITLVLGLGVGALGALGLARPHPRRRGLPLLALLLATFIMATAVVNLADLGAAAGGLSPEARLLLDTHAGSGLWLTLVAGFAGMAGGVVALAPAVSDPLRGTIGRERLPGASP